MLRRFLASILIVGAVEAVTDARNKRRAAMHAAAFVGKWLLFLRLWLRGSIFYAS
jgi:hypothetical protein